MPFPKYDWSDGGIKPAILHKAEVKNLATRDIVQEIEYIGKHISSKIFMLEQFVKHVPAPVCVVDTDWKITLYSKRYSEYFQLDKLGNLVGVIVFDLFKNTFNEINDFKQTCESLKKGETFNSDVIETKPITMNNTIPIMFSIEKFFLQNGSEYHAGYFIMCNEPYECKVKEARG